MVRERGLTEMEMRTRGMCRTKAGTIGRQPQMRPQLNSAVLGDRSVCGDSIEGERDVRAEVQGIDVPREIKAPDCAADDMKAESAEGATADSLVRSCLDLNRAPGITYRPPKAKMKIKPSFLFLSVCKFQTLQIGKMSSETSLTMLKPAPKSCSSF